ncbi:acetyl-CoA carboxylase [Microbacterium testaceum]|uniref:acetyl-CoA carboxylase n=1 Tax=Microbacterium testaceum TaxID=2033 RepID=UPI002AC4AA81|nr:acetyl-CoA carboxylase [Microbacterium testaceum]MDZ5144376.1 acetyl-CoA carboxylase [Microbacterium testaceum]
MTDIISPLPGVFYRRPGPGKDPYIETGDTVEAGQTIGVIEIMKQFSEIPAPIAGVVGEFLVADNGAVNPGDVIVTISET